MGAASDADCPYYEKTQGEHLAQGEILLDFPLLVLQEPYGDIRSDEGPSATVDHYDMIIVSQSCDLIYEKLESVLICPLFGVDETVGKLTTAESKRARESELKRLKQGLHPSLYPVPPCTLDELASPPRIVSFRQVAAVPLGLVQEEARRQAKRVRLRSPYREHLGQAFGNFIMRVGLPVPFELE